MPKVSVIIPVYNVEQYIERCARSLFEQTLDDIEYIFINDCTPDKSMEVLAQILEDYPSRKKQVKIINMPVNSGQAKVRKIGMEAASGDYIIYCDSDDWVDVTIYEKMWRKAISEDFDMIICGYRKTNEKETLMVEDLKTFTNKDVVRCIIADKMTAFTWNKLIRKDLYSLVDNWPKDNLCEDYAIIVPIADQCHSIGFVNEPLYNYFINESGICNSPLTLDKLMQTQRNVNLIISYIEKQDKGLKYKKELQHRKCILKSYAFPFDRSVYMNIYPETNFTCLFDTYSNLSQRLGHLTKLLGIHGISKIFRKKS